MRDQLARLPPHLPAAMLWGGQSKQEAMQVLTDLKVRLFTCPFVRSPFHTFCLRPHPLIQLLNLALFLFSFVHRNFVSPLGLGMCSPE